MSEAVTPMEEELAKTRYGMQSFARRIGERDKLGFAYVKISEKDSDAMVDKLCDMQTFNGAAVIGSQIDHHIDGQTTITLELDGRSFMRGQDELATERRKFEWLVGLLNVTQQKSIGLLASDYYGDVHGLQQQEIREEINRRFDLYVKACARVAGVKG